MRYFYEPSEYQGAKHWRYYHCDHPMYNQCTLYFQDGRGLAVVQEHFIEGTKMRYWGVVDRELANDIYISEGFEDYFEKYSGRENHGIFPTVPVRKLMWALRMKPLKREYWENNF